MKMPGEWREPFVAGEKSGRTRQGLVNSLFVFLRENNHTNHNQNRTVIGNLHQGVGACRPQRRCLLIHRRCLAQPQTDP